MLTKINPASGSALPGRVAAGKEKRTLEFRQSSVRKSPFAQKDGRKSAKERFNVTSALDRQFDKNQRRCRFSWNKLSTRRFCGLREAIHDPLITISRQQPGFTLQPWLECVGSGRSA